MSNLGLRRRGTSQHSPSRADPTDFMDEPDTWAKQEQQEPCGLDKNDWVETRSVGFWTRTTYRHLQLKPFLARAFGVSDYQNGIGAKWWRVQNPLEACYLHLFVRFIQFCQSVGFWVRMASHSRGGGIDIHFRDLHSASKCLHKFLSKHIVNKWIKRR